jgi:hypothetical protein
VAACVYQQYKASFLNTIAGAKAKELLMALHEEVIRAGQGPSPAEAMFAQLFLGRRT